jgi:hypothetical protein
MNIRLKFFCEGSSTNTQDFILKANQTALIPCIGDQVDVGSVPLKVKSRVFKYGKTETVVTLICTY